MTALELYPVYVLKMNVGQSAFQRGNETDAERQFIVKWIFDASIEPIVLITAHILLLYTAMSTGSGQHLIMQLK